ncbi:hypothetical protein AALB39_19690 [Lachnospiraceae bacterium 54-53]
MDNREVNYQNSVIKVLLEKLFVNESSIRVVDVSTQYKNWEKRSWHNRSKYAKRYTPDILIAVNWNICNKNNDDIKYLSLIEVKTPTAIDRKHAMEEVKEYLTVVPNVILTDCITWEFYDRKKDEPEIYCLENDKQRAAVCKRGDNKDIHWKISRGGFSDFLVEKLEFPRYYDADPDVWKELCKKLGSIIAIE